MARKTPPYILVGVEHIDAKLVALGQGSFQKDSKCHKNMVYILINLG